MKASISGGDEKKFRISLWAAAVLTVLVLAYTIAHEHFLADLQGYLQRKLYYETVISQKGLSLHKGEYWREKE